MISHTVPTWNRSWSSHSAIIHMPRTNTLLWRGNVERSIVCPKASVSTFHFSKCNLLSHVRISNSTLFPSFSEPQLGELGAVLTLAAHTLKWEWCRDYCGLCIRITPKFVSVLYFSDCQINHLCDNNKKIFPLFSCSSSLLSASPMMCYTWPRAGK